MTTMVNNKGCDDDKQFKGKKGDGYMTAAIYRSFGGPIRLERVKIPSIPEDGVLVEVKATGVCRSDWHGWKGHDSDVVNHGLPFCPGHELSGVVAQVGSQVQRFVVGDPVVAPFILSCGSCVFCHEDKSTVCAHQEQPGFTQWGSFAEYVVLPRADRNLSPILPKTSVSFRQAAALGCRFTTAYRAILQQARLQAKESIAIFGCGGLGLSCIMLAKALSAFPIIAIDISPQALDKARTVGATHTILSSSSSSSLSSPKKNNNHNHNNTQDTTTTTTTTSSSSLLSYTEIQKRIQEILGENDNDGGGVVRGTHVSVDAAGFSATSECAVWCTRPGGRMIQVGLPLGSKKPPMIPMAYVAGKELELIGSHGFAASDLPHLLQMVADKSIDPDQLIEKEVDLETGARELQNMDHQSPIGMTMITNFFDKKYDMSRL